VKQFGFNLISDLRSNPSVRQQRSEAKDLKPTNLQRKTRIWRATTFVLGRFSVAYLRIPTQVLLWSCLFKLFR
jgi:hypothetical protein